MGWENSNHGEKEARGLLYILVRGAGVVLRPGAALENMKKSRARSASRPVASGVAVERRLSRKI